MKRLVPSTPYVNTYLMENGEQVDLRGRCSQEFRMTNIHVMPNGAVNGPSIAFVGDHPSGLTVVMQVSLESLRPMLDEIRRLDDEAEKSDGHERI